MCAKETKICVICGDKSNGFNFNAITCFSCKQFFRRNALKNQDYICNFIGDCNVTLVTRKFCRSCRLKKCFSMGMNKALILTDQEKQLYRKKLLKIRNDSKIKSNNYNTKSPTNDRIECENKVKANTEPMIPKENNETHIMSDILQNNKISEMQIKDQMMEMENYITNKDINETSNDFKRREMEFQFSIKPIVRPLSDYRNTFNELERSKLTELFSAVTVLMDPKIEITSEITDYRLLQHIMCKHMDKEVRKVVKLTKRLSGFSSICENDQISLVKYGCLEIIHLRSVLFYNYENECFTLNIDSNTSYLLKMDFLKELKLEMYKPFKEYLPKFKSNCDSDAIVLDLLTAIALFNPERPNLEFKDVVKFQQQIYLYLLKRYLQLKYRSQSELESKFSDLMNTLVDLHVFDEISRQKIKSYPKLYGPLISEIYDIKAKD